jgi:hypothetical protein
VLALNNKTVKSPLDINGKFDIFEYNCEYNKDNLVQAIAVWMQ